MTDYNAPLYQHPQEIWDETTCAKKARKKSPYAPFKGYLGSFSAQPPAYGKVRYNGGCIREGKWWQGEERPLPIVHENYEIVVIRSWGWRIKKKD